MKIIIALLMCLQLAGCVTFENHRGEKFPFSLKVLSTDRPAPTVLISHGGSCRLAQEEAWASKFKAWGYNAVIIDHCSARGISPHTGVEPPPLNPVDRINDYIATAEWVRTQKWHTGKVAVFGISRGGEAVLRAAESRFARVRRGAEGLAELDVYVALYPACSYVPKAPRGPLLIMHGDADNLAVFKACEYSNLNHSNYTIKIYPNASHGFEVPGVDVVGFNKDLGNFIARRYDGVAAERSFKDTRDFLDIHLK